MQANGELADNTAIAQSIFNIVQDAAKVCK